MLRGEKAKGGETILCHNSFRSFRKALVLRDPYPLNSPPCKNVNGNMPYRNNNFRGREIYFGRTTRKCSVRNTELCCKIAANRKHRIMLQDSCQ